MTPSVALANGHVLKVSPYDQCFFELARVSEVHHPTTGTGRSLEATFRLLSLVKGAPGELGTSCPEFSLESLESGQESLLSLGEGKAKVVLDLNTASMQAMGEALHHAVDIAFRRSDRFVGTLEGFRNFPENYHAQSFQTLRLGTPGMHLRFDKVISSQSLVYVLMQQLQPGDYVGRARAKNMMMRILSHMNSEAVLAAWGLKLPDLELLGDLMHSLADEGLISDFGFFEVKGTSQLQRGFWLQRVKKTEVFQGFDDWPR